MARPKEIPGDIIRITITLSVDTHKQLQKKSNEQKKSIASLIRESLGEERI